MAGEWYLPPSDTSQRRSMKSTTPSIPAGYLLRAVTWPMAPGASGTASVVPNGEAPDLVAEEALGDTEAKMTVFSVGRRRLRAGGSFAARVPIKSSGGKMVAAASGDTYFYESVTAAGADNDLVLADFVGKKVMP